MLCPNCKKSLEQAIKVINYKGRSTLINVLKCNKCGHTFTALDQAEKARIILNPSFLL